MTRFVIMGVSGCGKTSVGEALAARVGLTFLDGDELHLTRNIAKMTNGVPLDDADRMPWLVEVGRALHRNGPMSAIGCSALKRAYRDTIRAEVAGPVYFLHLAAPQEVLQKRVEARRDHFMPPALLDSQYQALEALGPDEPGQAIDVTPNLDAVVKQAERYIKSVLA